MFDNNKNHFFFRSLHILPQIITYIIKARLFYCTLRRIRLRRLLTRRSWLSTRFLHSQTTQQQQQQIITCSKRPKHDIYLIHGSDIVNSMSCLPWCWLWFSSPDLYLCVHRNHRLLMVFKHSNNMYFLYIAALLASMHHLNACMNYRIFRFHDDNGYTEILFYVCQNIKTSSTKHIAQQEHTQYRQCNAWTIRKPWTIRVCSAYHWHIITFAPCTCSLCIFGQNRRTDRNRDR